MNEKIGRIKRILIERVGYGDEVAISLDEDTYISEFGFDSIDAATFVVSCEEEFGISIPDSEWENFLHCQIKDILALIPD